ncbi:diguanylate cyclase [Pseudoduganella sp. GCM10020061]|uniref:GGDEF domain-containing protein n=1 Tax=Pseudoduganella sp. GCM10020061 TaxID=3317345 RepID=UPI003636DBF4
MNKFFQEVLRPDALDRELVHKHEADIEFMLPRVGAVFGLCIVAFAGWDFIVEPAIAIQSLAIRTVAVLLAFLIFLPSAKRFGPEQRAGFMFAVYLCGVMLAEVRSTLPSSIAGVTACLATVWLVSIRIRTFVAMVAIPSVLFTVLVFTRLPMMEALNALMMYVVSLIIALLVMVTARQFRRRSAALRAQLLSTARYDSLTGVCNRGYILELALRELELARRHARPLAVAMLDIDYFKRINDTYGHDVGDKVIREVARACVEHLRATDHFGRFGGEEFIAVLPEMDAAAAVQCAERLRAAIAAVAVPTPQGEVHANASIGVALLPPGGTADWQALLKQADVALYRAKAGGRNRVVLNEDAIAPR